MSSRWIERLRYALAFRVALWYGALFVASAVALVAITYVLLSRSLEAEDREVIASMLDRYSGEYEASGLPGLDRAIAADRLEGRHERLLIRVIGPGNQPIYFNVPAGLEEFDLSQLDSLRQGRVSGGVFTVGGGPDTTLLEVASRRLQDGTIVQVGRSSRTRDELLQHFRSRVLLVLFFIVLIATVGGALLNHLALAPVRTMAATVRSIVQTGRLDTRVPIRGTGDSLDELSALVNGMLERIQVLIQGMRGALDNVAHDLRTPLTRLRSVAEAALTSHGTSTSREDLARVLEETERVSDVLTTLMDISEAETGAMKLARDRVRLSDVVKDACDLYADAAEDKRITLAFSVDAAIELPADRRRLRQAIANLVDNAVKYTPEGGRVELDAQAAAGTVTLFVRDTGPGIPPQDLHRIWDRLYRGDASRSERGLGLGLSLVKAIVESHGGAVSVSSSSDRGCVFAMVLPA